MRMSVCSSCNSNAPYKDKTIRDILYRLKLPFEKFLAYRKLSNHNADELIALSQSYRERNLLKLFETTVNKTFATLPNSIIQRANTVMPYNCLIC